MSQQTQTDSEQVKDEIESRADEFLTTAGTESKSIDMDVDTPLGQLESEDHERKFDPRVTGERFVELYDKRKAFIREYLSNAEMATYTRAIEECINEGYDKDTLLEMDVRDVFDLAREEAGYEPVVRVEHHHSDEDPTLVIEDNGIGIPVNTYTALRDAGYSGWHGVAGGNGQFGVGTLSAFLGCGVNSKFKMVTKSFETDETYGIEWRMTKNNPMPWEKDSYGTRFEWPSFCHEAQDINVVSAVSEYVEGLRVPVLYEEYDSNGDYSGGRSEEYGSTFMEDRLPDDEPIITYSDSYVRAVASPAIGTGYRADHTPKTFNVSHPTDRNDGYGSPDKYSSPWYFDIRVKREAPNGIIYECESDPDLVGLQPVQQGKYEEQMEDDAKEQHIPWPDVPDDAVITPSVTGDRDRFEKPDRVTEFCRRVSEHLYDEYRTLIADIFEQIDDFDDLFELDQGDLNLLINGVEEFGPNYSQNKAENMVEAFEDELGVSLSVDVCEKIDSMTRNVSLAPRGRLSATRKSSRRTKQVRQVIEKAKPDGDVYMGNRLYEKKMKLVWAMNENNQVVQVPSNRQGRYAETYGWKMMTDLPTDADTVEEQFDVSDEVVDKFRRSTSTSTSSSSTVGVDAKGGFDDEKAKQRKVKIRSRGRGNYTSYTGETIFEALNNPDDDDSRITYGASEIEHLIIYDDDKSFTAGAHMVDSERGVFFAMVPQYVYDYFERAENIYTSEDEYLNRVATWTMDFDWARDDLDTEVEYGEITENDVIISLREKDRETLAEYDILDDYESFVTQYLDIDTVDRIKFCGRHDITDYLYAVKQGAVDTSDSGPSVIKMTKSIGLSVDVNVSIRSAVFDTVLPELDRSAPEWKNIDVGIDDDKMIAMLQRLEAAGGFPSTDNEDDVESDD